MVGVGGHRLISHAGWLFMVSRVAQRKNSSSQPVSEVVVSRRSMLKGLGVGGATVLVAGTGVVSYRVFDNGVLEAGSGEPYEAWVRWREDSGPLGMVAAAILAANPHNIQPWLFHASPTMVDVFTDMSRSIASLDPFDRERHVGLGCAVENLVLAAGARGHQPTVTWLPDTADRTHIARVTLVPGPVVQSSLYDAIGERHTNRGPYKGKPVPVGMLDALSAQITGLDGVSVRWFAEPDQKAALGALIIEATTAIVADDVQSRDGFAWFRNNRDDIDTHMDGLTLDGQGLDSVTLSLAKVLPATSRGAGDAFWLDQTRTVHTATAAAYGVITVVNPDEPSQRLTGGRLLERIHLASAANGLALHHMNQITEQIDRERSLGEAATFAPRLEQLLATPGRHGLVVFRIGYPVRPARRSPRRPAAQVTR